MARCGLRSPCCVSRCSRGLGLLFESSLLGISSIFAGFEVSRRFAAFPSCGVPARWRDLPNVVLGICRK